MDATGNDDPIQSHPCSLSVRFCCCACCIVHLIDGCMISEIPNVPSNLIGSSILHLQVYIIDMDPAFDRGNLKIPDMYADWLVTTGGGTRSTSLHFTDCLLLEGIPSTQTMWSLTALRCSELTHPSMPTICRIKVRSETSVLLPWPFYQLSLPTKMSFCPQLQYQAYGIALDCVRRAQSRHQTIQEKNVTYLVDAGTTSNRCSIKLFATHLSPYFFHHLCANLKK